MKRKIISIISVMCASVVIFCKVIDVNAAQINVTSEVVAQHFLNKVGQPVKKASCLSFIADSFAELGATRSSANCAWEYGNAHIVSNSMNDIPVGADVFFNWNSNYTGTWYTCGDHYCHHIGVYVGDGYVVHTSSGMVIKTKLDKLVSSWNMDFRGWGYHGNVILEDSNHGNTISNIFSSSGTVSEITDTSAKISAKLNGTYNVSTCGFDIGLSPETMGRVTENANTKVNSMWYSLGNGSKWYGTLKPGTTYYYRFFAIINGVEHVGTVQSFTTSTRIPQGNVDSITGGSGCFNISGWAFDRDDLSKALEIHVYLGNENAPEELCAVIEANKYRQDVNDVYPDVGVNHGFEQTITTNRTGNQTIYVYAINVGSGNENPLLGKQTITIAKDIEAPIITNAYISESTNEKFTIIINANDNCGIEDVWLDLTNAKTNVATILNKATKIGEGIYSYTLDESTANNLLKGYEGKYTISIEAIDKEWNYSKEYKLEHVVDLTSPTISNVQVTDVSETGYTVTCTVVDDVRLNRVQFPTWTAANGQDDLAQDWWNNTSITGKINGAQVSFRVNASDHNNETGVYRTHIYAIDSCGNSVCYEIPDIIVKQNNPFNDVQEGRFFYDPVLWAVKNNITTGTSPVTFSPDDPCTRAQVVTFIWRAIGRPEASNKSAFEDLREGAYYLDAVDWAVENKITTGTSPNTFSPDAACTRAQIVTFLWRVAGCPKPSKESAFEDLREGAYYLDAVSWAVEEGITIGTSPTKFSPDEKCTRAQVVTFLYRYIY